MTDIISMSNWARQGRRIPCRNENRDAKRKLASISKSLKELKGKRFPNLKCAIKVDIQMIDRWTGDIVHRFSWSGAEKSQEETEIVTFSLKIK